MPGQKNMPSIAAIDHTLRDIYSSPSKVCLVVNIGDPIDRAAVNTHPQLDVRTISQGSANLERTPHWLFRAMEEQERHPIAGWHSDEFAACFRRPKTFGISDDLIQFLEKFNLFVDQQFRITHYID
jgi:hypothetical protein